MGVPVCAEVGCAWVAERWLAGYIAVRTALLAREYMVHWQT